jgi:hypothetical protein
MGPIVARKPNIVPSAVDMLADLRIPNFIAGSYDNLLEHHQIWLYFV